uniref:Uncharacterized protein n=1 Tax=Meloidogyne enterolobii TaxID=390850 RepID=A0A6V7VC47_MELEN|nr:unnamed protein product [Meloidogyne enterolobii]
MSQQKEQFPTTKKWKALLKLFCDNIPQATNFSYFLPYQNTFTGEQAQLCIYKISPQFFEKQNCTMLTAKNTCCSYLKNFKYILNAKNERDLVFDEKMLYRLNWPIINDKLEGFELDPLPSSSFTASNSVRRASSLRGSEDTEGRETPVCKKSTSVRDLVGSFLSRSSSERRSPSPAITNKRSDPKFLDKNILKDNNSTNTSRGYNFNNKPKTSKSIWTNDYNRQYREKRPASAQRPCSVNSSQNFSFCKQISKLEYQQESSNKQQSKHLTTLLESIISDQNLSENEKVVKLRDFKIAYPTIYQAKFGKEKLTDVPKINYFPSINNNNLLLKKNNEATTDLSKNFKKIIF